MLHIIGKCVTVMNKHYWDEYKNAFTNSNELNKVLKFHQLTLPIIDPEKIIKNDGFKQEWINTKEKRVVFSDTMIKRYYIYDLKEHLMKIFFNLKEIFKTSYMNTTLPVLVVYNESLGVDLGCYTFNFEDNFLIKYNELQNSNGVFNKIIDGGVSFSLSYFLSIEDSVYMYGVSGYKKGILQIGEISEKMKIYLNEQNFKINCYFVSEQMFTHNIGINLRKQLLIVNQFVGE